jgi:hypothetical protein
MLIIEKKLSKNTCDQIIEICKNTFDLFKKNTTVYNKKITNREETNYNWKQTNIGKIWDQHIGADEREQLIQNNWQKNTFSEIKVELSNLNYLYISKYYINFELDIISNLIHKEFESCFKYNKEKFRIVVRKSFPGRIWPPHRDYPNQNNGPVEEHITIDDNEKTKIYRLWISLTEPKFGHFLIVEDKFVYWHEQGTIITWNSNEMHIGGNVGYEDRYILTMVNGK